MNNISSNNSSLLYWKLIIFKINIIIQKFTKNHYQKTWNDNEYRITSSMKNGFNFLKYELFDMKTSSTKMCSKFEQQNFIQKYTRKNMPRNSNFSIKYQIIQDYFFCTKNIMIKLCKVKWSKWYTKMYLNQI